MDALYIIRAFQCGSGFGPKLWLVFAALALAGWDHYRHRRWDCWWVLLVGSVTWTAVELVLQLSGIRVMPEHTLFGISLPLCLSTPLQGAAEGGALAVIGLFLGDRLLSRNTRVLPLLVLLVLCTTAMAAVIPYGEVVREVTSRRNILAAPSVLFCAALVLVDAVFWGRWPCFRKRAAAMFAVLLAIGTSWTIAAYASGGRWIEVAGPAAGTYSRASPVLQAVGLSYDVVVEIALAYVPFLAVPSMCGFISKTLPGPRES
jgi:hypothetical protein